MRLYGTWNVHHSYSSGNCTLLSVNNPVTFNYNLRVLHCITFWGSLSVSASSEYSSSCWNGLFSILAVADRLKMLQFYRFVPTPNHCSFHMVVSQGILKLLCSLIIMQQLILSAKQMFAGTYYSYSCCTNKCTKG